MPSFVANGLLSSALTSSSSMNWDSQPEPFPSTQASGSITNEIEESCSDLQGIDIISEISCPIDLSFKSTGLLDQSAPLPEDDIPHFATASFGAPSLLGETSLSTNSSRSSFTPSSGPTIPPSGPCITARTFDGKPVYFRRKSKKKIPNCNLTTTARSISRLLDLPIHRMLDSLSAGLVNQLQQSEQEPLSAAAENSPKEDTLWVDRYRPTRFTELLGNERIARETLTWVKRWDLCVFGKRPKDKRKVASDDENQESLDELHRPQQKILLLSGPPGLGKTTLAHVVARQAGYELMEINASDARTGSVIDDRIRPALESGSAVGKKKPMLLVIDEIDGATGTGDNPSSFVSKLVQLIQYKPKKKRGANTAHGPQSKSPILRPIICICNDAYASCLTKLRPHAYHLRYMRPADTHIVNRLRHICEAETLSIESRALSTLVGVAKGDLRGCLNTLQFLKSRCEHVTEAAVRRATVGMKETDVSLNAILNDLFSPLSKKRVHELGLPDDDELRYTSRLSTEIESSGRESTIAVGCFAQYPKMRQHDANLSRYEKANEWLLVYDGFSSAMYSGGDFALLQYLPYTLVPFYPLFSERCTQVERSQEDWEHIQLTRTNEEIYKSISRNLRNSSTCDYKRLLTSPTLELEFAPYINRIISPPIKPVNSQVVRLEEKTVLTRLIDIMISLDLNFVQERTEDGQLTYRLDPPIDVFVTYDGRRAADIPVSRYAVRQLVANEINAKFIARETCSTGKGGKRPGAQGPFVSETSESGPPNKRARIDYEVAAAVDFFGRPIVRTQSDVRKDLEKAEKKFRVKYRFSEGNSAAVRKPIKVGAFL